MTEADPFRLVHSVASLKYFTLQWSCACQQERSFEMLRDSVVGQWIFTKVPCLPVLFPVSPIPTIPTLLQVTFLPHPAQSASFIEGKTQKNIDNSQFFFFDFKRLSPKGSWKHSSPKSSGFQSHWTQQAPFSFNSIFLLQKISKIYTSWENSKQAWCAHHQLQ